MFRRVSRCTTSITCCATSNGPAREPSHCHGWLISVPPPLVGSHINVAGLYDTAGRLTPLAIYFGEVYPSTLNTSTSIVAMVWS